ncbi:hypothetical protein AKJ09_01370 [Labilithrix luteola]|uniref:Uncharacterized protein n=2 Tax=Labilithrix luteola TaxID=1391654 RepID=A0A0K1PMU3_9BACT|nr:hypothetical protein AKJ09_01370 [Labilithrix luteola]
MAPPRPSNAELGDRLDAIRSGTVGRWYGNVTTPWIPAYSVYFEFDADGHYATRTTDPTMVALYYGTDLDTPLKQWRLDDVNQSGAASGTIDVAFDYETFFALPAWQGELHNVVLDASGNRLRFAFFTSSGYGPVEFDLWRCAP